MDEITKEKKCKFILQSQKQNCTKSEGTLSGYYK